MSTNGTTTEKERYQVYLAGREWGLLKQQVKARSGGICERCKINPSDAVHHLTYERKYHERLEDLQDTCEACHRYTHGLSDEDPAKDECPIAATITGMFRTNMFLFIFCIKHEFTETNNNQLYGVLHKRFIDPVLSRLINLSEDPNRTWPIQHLRSFLGMTVKVKLDDASDTEIRKLCKLEMPEDAKPDFSFAFFAVDVG